MTDPRMPLDPFEDEDVDLWELERAEMLARDGDPDDIRWHDLEGPTIDDFDSNGDSGPNDPSTGWDALDPLSKITIVGLALGLLGLLAALLHPVG